MLSLLVPDLLPPNILLLPAPRGWEGCDEQEDYICQRRGSRLRGQKAPGFLPERGRERAPMQCLIWYSTALFLGESGCLVSGEAARGRGLICAHSLLPWTAHRAISAICPQPIIPRPSCTGCLTALIVKRGDYRVECRDWQVPEGPAALVAEWTPSDTVLSLKAYFLVV